MAQITLGGNPVNTAGELPSVGEKAPNFTLTNTDLKDQKLSDYTGKNVVLNIFPSIDTSVCAASVRQFNKDAANKDNTVVLNISKDLPMAHKRFCAAEGLEGVLSLSEFKDQNFSDQYGVRMMDGGMEGFMSRAVMVVDPHGNVTHAEQVPEIGQEPNYEAALAALK
jgi:thiol peroxidase